MYIINTWESGSLFIGTAYRVCSSRNLSSELIKNSYTMNHYSERDIKIKLGKKKKGFVMMNEKLHLILIIECKFRLIKYRRFA